MNHSTGFTPFFLTYGAETVLPSDLDYRAPRVKAFAPDQAAEVQRDAIDLLEEVRETAIFAPPATNKPCARTTRGELEHERWK